jgi:hypothetical protein
LVDEPQEIWWIWRNGISYLAYDKEYPVYPDGGDPLTLGEPVFWGTRPAFKALHPDAVVDFRRARGRDDDDC